MSNRFRRLSDEERSGHQQNQRSFSSNEGGDTVANSPEPQASFRSTPVQPSPGSRKNSFSSIAEKFSSSSFANAFRSNKAKHKRQATKPDGTPLGDILEREDSDVLARPNDKKELVNFWDFVNGEPPYGGRKGKDSDTISAKPLPPLPRDQPPARRTAVDMDSSLMVPGGLDRSKQIKDAKDMWQTIVRNAERTNTSLPPFQFLELIGKGGFGRVYKCFDKSRGMLVAVKLIELDATDFTVHLSQRDEALKDIRKEVAIMQQLKDSKAKNVNLIFDAFDLHSYLWIVSAYCTGGSIKTLMRASPRPGLDERFIVILARETAIALKSVHDIGIIHRDIKCTNIYVPEDGGIELGDFGVVGIMEDPRSKRTTIVGTPYHMPKEMHIQDMSVPGGYGAEVDIWAYGCTVYEMATGFSPNQGQDLANLSFLLERAAPRLEDVHDSKYSQGLCDFVAFCLNSDPVARPTADQILEHPFIADTSESHPSTDLVQLIERYAVWEFKGGQRNSLFNDGGAAAPLDFGDELPEAEEGMDDWNFSTSDNFNKRFTRRYSHMLFGDEGPQFEAPAGSGLPPLKTKDLTPLERIQQDHQEKSATRGAESLDRLFNPEAAPYDMSTPVDFPGPEPLSDLPLRNIGTGAGVRESTVMIDLDADASYTSGPTFNFDFEDIPTIKAKGRHSVSDDGGDDENEEDDDYQYGQDQDTKRATKDWTFPSMNTATKVAAQPKRATMDWTFSTAEEKEPEEDDTVMNLPPAGNGGAMAPGFRPQLKHTATVPLGQFGDFLHTTQPQHSMAAPTPGSPVRDSMSSMIDLDLGLADPAEIVRPLTASSAADSTNTEMTSGNPFDLEEDPEQNERDRDRFSYHKQWQSDGGVSNGNRGSLRNMPLHNRGTSLIAAEPEIEHGSQVPATAEDVFGASSSFTSSDAMRGPMHMSVPHTAPLGPNNAWPNFDSSNNSPANSGINVPQLGDPNFPLSNGLQFHGPAIGPPRSIAASGVQGRGNGNLRTNANISQEPLELPSVLPPNPAALEEGASSELVADELTRLMENLEDMFDQVSVALRRATGQDNSNQTSSDGSRTPFDGFSMGEESDGGFDSTSSFGFRSGDEEGF